MYCILPKYDEEYCGNVRIGLSWNAVSHKLIHWFYTCTQFIRHCVDIAQFCWISVGYKHYRCGLLRRVTSSTRFTHGGPIQQWHKAVNMYANYIKLNWKQGNIHILALYTKSSALQLFHTLRPEQNICGRLKIPVHFLNDEFYLLTQILLKLIREDSVDSVSASVQVMAWRWTDNKLSPEMMVI